MKKVRISKKNPNRVLKAIQTRVSPNRDPHKIQYSLKNSVHFQQLRHSSNPKQSMKDHVIHSHRYKHSEPSIEIQRRRDSYSPRQFVSFKSQEKQKYENRKSKKGSVFAQLFHKSVSKSPYLEQKSFNKSERRLVFGARELIEPGRIHNKHLKNIRFNSSEQKSDSIDIRKTSESGDMIKEAKNLMIAGESRKSMLILKPILNREPGNLNALHIAAINLYNIGDYQKSSAYLDEIIRNNKSFNMGVYFLRAKIFLKQGKDVKNSLSKLDQCLQLFPQSEQVYIEKGQIYLMISEHKEAFKCFQQAMKLAPLSVVAHQKMIISLQHLKQYKKVLEIIQKVSKLNPLSVKKYHSSKIKTLFELKMYNELIRQCEKSDKNDGNVLCYYGYALFKAKDLLKSYLVLEASLANIQDCKKPVQLMLLILCLSNDFYEAYHLMQRCQFLNIEKEDLKAQFSFIEGTVCLMKRNTYEGVQKLNIASQLMKNRNDDFAEYSNGVINSFMAYGYFCLGNHEKSQNHYQIQLKQHHEVLFEGMSYNMNLNKGFIHYQSGNLKEAYKIFEQISAIDHKRIQPHFCLAIICVNLYFFEKQRAQSQADVTKINKYLDRAKQIFHKYAHLAGKFNNNIGANFSYHKSVLHSYMNEWREAIITIDEAIQKSQENYWKYYYTRALNMACIHNFTGAIDDCSAAINLKQYEPNPYYLRSCCFQIQGEGNYAFKDLQTYISLRPDDKAIHKFAGKLLFQNGAFEDALAAFNHQDIPETLENEDVFLTKSKTYFLLGRFLEASQEMLKVFQINNRRKQALFDGKMMQIIDKLLNQGQKNYNQVIKLIDEAYMGTSSTSIKSQIFKKTESHTLKAICYFYCQDYNKTIEELEKASIAKQKTILKQSLIQGSSRQDQKDTRLYVNQMNFNISLCYFIMDNLDMANKYALKMNFYSNDPFYQPHQRYLKILQGKFKVFPGHQQQITKVQVFPSRNKISNFLSEVSTTINNQTVYFKMCIPFPKVEPPQIFPNFDQNLIKQFSIQRIERKSEAPWICREDNTIKFTSKMQKYSRLEIQQSGTEMSPTETQIDNSHVSMNSIMSRRSKASMSMKTKLEIKQGQKQYI